MKWFKKPPQETTPPVPERERTHHDTPADGGKSIDPVHIPQPAPVDEHPKPPTPSPPQDSSNDD